MNKIEAYVFGNGITVWRDEGGNIHFRTASDYFWINAKEAQDFYTLMRKYEQDDINDNDV